MKIDTEFVRAGSVRLAIAPPSRDLMTRTQAAAYLGISAWLIDAHGRRGTLTRYRVGGPRQTRYARAELDKLVVVVGARPVERCEVISRTDVRQISQELNEVAR